ncbi:MerR family transcriptional regulator [Dactylosporangium sp. CS-047395]|uniref:MerR family transcriptional regulator n=1 Tax=Dactylosporangium sp. CS-047395 TaxID=3239936 RepID=UPI003D8C031F
MRVKEIAELTGATVRAIRYYHQIGLLPVPAVRDGCRHYDLTHVARLTRIRWLAQAGIPLSRIAGILAMPARSGGTDRAAAAGTADRTAALADLRATVVALEDQLEQLRTQRDRVRRLMASVEQGEHLSPMPAAMARFYDDLERRAGNEQVRRVIRRERDFMEVALYRGDMPPEAAVLYERFTDASRAESLAVFGQIAARSHASLSHEEMRRIAAAVVDRISGQLGPDLPRVFGSLDLDVVRRAADLYVRLAEPADRALDRIIADALVTAMEHMGG